MQNKKISSTIDQETKLKLMHVPLYLGHHSREAIIKQRLQGKEEALLKRTDATSSTGLVNRTRSITPTQKSSNLTNKSGANNRSINLEIAPVPRTSGESSIRPKQATRPRLLTGSMEALKNMQSGPLSPFTRKKFLDMKINADLQEHISGSNLP